MRITDLTQTLRSGLRGFSSEQVMSIGHDGWNATALHLYSHAGTHIDAPCHFLPGEAGIDSLPPEKLITDCHLADIHIPSSSYIMNTDCLGSITERINPGEGILFRTGWSRHSDNEEIYRNALPRISNELATWLVKKKVSLIGVEAPSIADVNNIKEVGEIHRILLGAGIIIVEGLVNLDRLTNTRVKLIALPLKIQNCDGSPCRAIAIEDENN
jgi:kynurenine formamidase